MQKFDVDMQRPGVPLVVYAKQGDTARAIQLEMFDGGMPYTPPDSSRAIVFYKTASGEGNYSQNVVIAGNLLKIPLIAQMLTNAGGGLMCVVIGAPDGALATWNMEVRVEGVPGIDSKAATEWYTALSEVVGETLKNALRAETAAASAEKSAKESAASASTAQAITDRYDNDLAGSTEKTTEIVTCNLLSGTPLDVVSHIAPVQEGAGDPSPTNVRPIKGWSGVNLTQSGRNLAKLLPDASTRNGVTRTLNPVTGEFTLKGTPTKAFSLALTSSMQMPGGATITNGVDNNFFESMPEGAYLYLRDTVSDKEYATLDVNRHAAKTVAFPAGSGVTVDARLYIPKGKPIDVTFRYAMVQGSTAPTIYQPYQGKDYTQQFDQPVYGGKYHWNTGELTSSWKKVMLSSVPLGLYTAEPSKGITKFSGTLPGGAPGEDNIISNKLKYKARAHGRQDPWLCSTHATLDEYLYLTVPESIAKTPEEFKSWLAQNGDIEIAYKTTNPETIQLTPQPILALNGNNTLYSDAGGNITVSRQANIFDAIYPVGSIYTSVSPVDPGNLFGGKWEQIEGRFLLAADRQHSAGSTGGEEKHTLTSAELPSSFNDLIVNGNSGWKVGTDLNLGIETQETNYVKLTGVEATSGKTHKLGSYIGSGQAHNNMPPYLAVYIFQRIA